MTIRKSEITTYHEKVLFEDLNYQANTIFRFSFAS